MSAIRSSDSEGEALTSMVRSLAHSSEAGGFVVTSLMYLRKHSSSLAIRTGGEYCLTAGMGELTIDFESAAYSNSLLGHIPIV